MNVRISTRSITAPNEPKHPKNPGWILRTLLRQDEGTEVRLERDRALLAFALVSPGRASSFATHTHLPEGPLHNCAAIESLWVSPDQADADTLGAILYLALRRARIEGYTNVVLVRPEHDQGLCSMLDLRPLSRLGASPEAVAGRVKRAMIRAFAVCDGPTQELLREGFIDEIIATHARWMQRFFAGSWACAIRSGRMTREQYVCTLQNMHQYVRQTTRLAARGIAYARDDRMRDHYIHHLRGEINHEVLLERDLEQLGEDVDYLKHARVPDPATREFMAVQHSVIAYDRDPLLLLACPMAAEGISAHIDAELMATLHRTIASWGLSDPKRATSFLSSHVHTDGGEDGHYQAVVETIRASLRDEVHLQQFLSVLTAATTAFERTFNSIIDDLALWSASPMERA